MAKSTGIMLTATGISFANEWVNTDQPNFRVVAAGLFSTLFLDGIERVNENLGVGLARILFVTVLLTPFNGKSPFQTVLDVTQSGTSSLPSINKAVTRTAPNPVAHFNTTN